MKFDYAVYFFPPSPAYPNRYSVLRPIIPITICHLDRHVRAMALIDSGSDDCLFPIDIGKSLGLVVENGKPSAYRGCGGGTFTAYFHQITIEIAGWKYPCYVGFTQGKLPAPILGQYGFFNLFKIIFDKEKEIIELIPKNNI